MTDSLKGAARIAITHTSDLERGGSTVYWSDRFLNA